MVISRAKPLPAIITFKYVRERFHRNPEIGSSKKAIS